MLSRGRPAPLPPDPEVVVIHTSVRGLLAAAVTPTVLIWLGLLGWASIGARPVPVTFVVLGGVLGAVALFDYPRRVEFDRAGVHRICPGRRHSLSWEQLVAFERPRPSSMTTVRNLRERPDEPMVSGGLIARGTGRRRWLLTDQLESRDEYDRLRTLLDEVASSVRPRAPRPHAGAPPSDLYRPARRRGAGA